MSVFHELPFALFLFVQLLGLLCCNRLKKFFILKYFKHTQKNTEEYSQLPCAVTQIQQLQTFCHCEFIHSQPRFSFWNILKCIRYQVPSPVNISGKRNKPKQGIQIGKEKRNYPTYR